MYNAVLIIQIIATIICFASVILMAAKRTSSYSNIMLVAFICGFIQNAGYLQELMATNMNEGLNAIRFEYIGGAFEIGLITLFMFKYCGHEVVPFIKAFLLIEGGVILVSVWTCQWVNIYYSSTGFTSEGTIPHMILGHGWLYYVFAATTICELIACIFILIVSTLHTKQSHMMTNYAILIVVSAIPLIGYVVSISGVLGEFDATPLSVAVAIGLFAVSIAGNHVFDVADVIGDKILADLDNAIIMINTEEGYEYSNSRARELFPALKKYTKGKILAEHEIKALFDKEREHEINIGGRYFDVSVNKVTSGNKNVHVGTAVVLFDVTESKNQISRFKEFVEETEGMNKARNTFLDNISNEFRTPINTVMGMSEVLQRDYSSPDTDMYIESIRNAGTTLVNLVNDIHDFSKIESGKMELVSDNFDMKKYMAEMVDLYALRCSKKGLEFSADIDQKLPRHLVGDIMRIKQVFNNLLSNAVKYTDEGSVKMKLGYKHRSDLDVDLIFAVDDTGIGIDEEDKQKLFERFSRANKKLKTNADGTGLGLTITKQLVDLMGGAINFKSELGKGSSFSVIIPVKTSADNSETIGDIGTHNNKEEVFRASFTAPDAKVMIVDDSKTNLIVIRELLKETKAQITIVQSGEKCLELMNSEHFDLLLLDHKMPGLDGIETFQRLRSSEGQGKDIPVVMLTANASEDSREFYLSRNFTDFLSKPVSAENVTQMLYKYLPEQLIIKN